VCVCGGIDGRGDDDDDNDGNSCDHPIVFVF